MIIGRPERFQRLSDRSQQGRETILAPAMSTVTEKQGSLYCATSRPVRTVSQEGRPVESEQNVLLIQDIEACRGAMRKARQDGKTIGLVPTMGALHEGHLSLIHAARKRCDFVAVTIFVNPTQFEPGADLDAYPRTPEADLAACESAGVDLLFSPSASAVNPDRQSATVHVPGVTDGLCAALRPGHFDGVATIVTKLFNMVPADVAFFGEKDYQQLAMIRRMVRDLNVPIEIVGCPTIREPDGLACSSRNVYLSQPEREQAACLNQALFAAADRIRAGQRDAREIAAAIRDQILAAGPAEIEYVDVVDASTLETLGKIDRPARICLAVRFGSCRLIDNVGVDAT